MSTVWRDLRLDPPKAEHEPRVLLWNKIMHEDEDFPGHPVSISNVPYALGPHALEQGYTHWMPMPAGSERPPE